MARKGSPKVRTGCLTCKVRKVKCDEGKPHCKRCTDTGRTCDGYAPSPGSSAIIWHRPRHMFSNVDSISERRSLEFFCKVAAPALSGPLDPYFWTHLVMQFSHFEPAVRHSIIAVGSLYEQVNRDAVEETLEPDHKFVLTHYNAAIRHLSSMEKESLVLLVCVLFICIEFLRGDRQAAIAHGNHGASILKRVEKSLPWAKEYLSPLFRRLNLLPYFFFVPNTPRPEILGLDDDLPPCFADFGQAEYYLDPIVARTIRLVRSGDMFRYNNIQLEDLPQELIAEQDATRSKLKAWYLNFADLLISTEGWSTKASLRSNMMIRYQVSSIWVETALDSSETIYDDYINTFRSIVDQACGLEFHNTHVFTFETGFTPLLYFVVMKCRNLDIRLRALAVMRNLGAARENLWDLMTIYAAAKRIIEIEHDAIIDANGEIVGTPLCPGPPPDELRIRDTTTEPNPVYEEVDGKERRGRLAGFFMMDGDGRISARSEFLVESADPPNTLSVFNDQMPAKPHRSQILQGSVSELAIELTGTFPFFFQRVCPPEIPGSPV
ncbi:hypothetical protein GGR57DRAFT_276658 [Xylariaceae sp. FL1272]|nr:hypothetical protein GGR57DRAFT_276658 [Xylariaceae sp. FL1272]